MSAFSPQEYCDALRVLVFANLLWLRSQARASRAVPSVYSAGVRFRPEPQAGTGVELYQTIPEVIAQGWGDCDDVTGWRVAELLSAGESGADVALIEQGSRVWHAVARRANGTTEDVAARLRQMEVSRWRLF
jgi:hypothetical protein